MWPKRKEDLYKNGIGGPIAIDKQFPDIDVEVFVGISHRWRFEQ